MKIGVISDTHDRLDSLVKAIQLLKQENVETVIHCGDWVSPSTLEFYAAECQKIKLLAPTYSVLGNNEGDIKRIIERNAKLKNPIRFADKTVLTLNLDNKKIVVYHGQDELITQALIASQAYDVVFHGHTHQIREEQIGQTLVVNPGSTSYTTKSRIINQASLAIYLTQTNKVTIKYL